jgi:hypothetical protein
MGILSGLLSGGIAGIGDAVKNVVSSFKLDPTVEANLNEQLQATVMAHAEVMGKQADDMMAAQLADVASARDMEIKLNEASGSSWMSKNIVPILAVFVSIIWGSVTVYLILRMVNLIASDPNVNMTALLGVYSALSGMEGIILNFFFGSSSSSQKKDETIATIAKQP